DRSLNLHALLERVRRLRPSPSAERLERWRAHKQRAVEQGQRDADAALARARDAVPAAELFRALHRALPASSIVVDEIVAQTPQMLQFLFEQKPIEQYRGWVAALGTSIGTALGAKLARPDRLL